MPKTRDIPTELKEFNSIFEKIAYRHDYSVVFNDFLDFAIKGFSPIGDFEELNKYGQSRYTLDERQLFGKLIFEWINVMNKQIEGDNDWYDAFGTFYEVLASNGKKSAFGQFFTPETVCNFMTQIIGGENMQKKLINEPACGSGRFVISFHAHHPGNYYFAEDLDQVCCKMTVLNMLMHGCVGVVINHNSLMQGDFRNAWVVNESLNNCGVPTIRKITREEVNTFYMLWKPWEDKIIKRVEETTKPAMVAAEPTKPQELKFEKVEQLSLFS